MQNANTTKNGEGAEQELKLHIYSHQNENISKEENRRKHTKIKTKVMF